MSKKRKYKKRLNDDELLRVIVNKQLEPFDVTFEDVKNDDDWLNKYIVTQEQSEEWFEWGVNFIYENAKKVSLRTKKRARKEMGWINLYCGLTAVKLKREVLIEKI